MIHIYAPGDIDMKLKLSPQQQLYGVIALTIIVVFIVIGAIYGDKEKKLQSEFSAQLFQHAVPEEARLVTTSATNSKDNGVPFSNATVILQTEMSQEELEAFYEDLTVAPVKEGYSASLKVLPVSEESLETLKGTKYYQEEGGSYWYIYIYSALITQ